MDIEIILQACSLDDPLPKLLKSSAPMDKLATGAQNRKKKKKKTLNNFSSKTDG